MTASVVALYSKFFANRRFTTLTVYELHSRLTQYVRTRATNAFKDANPKIMLDFYVVSRGIDPQLWSLSSKLGCLPAPSSIYAVWGALVAPGTTAVLVSVKNDFRPRFGNGRI